MKKTIIAFVMLGGIIMSAFHSDESPRADISNGILKARLYLPDTKNGYYMATRFDWSGVISSLEYKGHNYFGQWFEKYRSGHEPQRDLPRLGHIIIRGIPVQR